MRMTLDRWVSYTVTYLSWVLLAKGRRAGIDTPRLSMAGQKHYFHIFILSLVLHHLSLSLQGKQKFVFNTP